MDKYQLEVSCEELQMLYAVMGYHSVSSINALLEDTVLPFRDSSSEHDGESYYLYSKLHNLIAPFIDKINKLNKINKDEVE